MHRNETHTDPDDALMSQIACGDSKALEVLFIRYRDRVFNLAYRHLGNRSEAEDITQESFLRVLSAAKRYRSEGTFKSWLFTITTRLCMKKQAKHSTWRESLLGIFHPKMESSIQNTKDPLESHIAEEKSQLVRHAILALPPDQRMAIILSRFEELSYEEVAGIMGKSVQAVTSLLWRGKTTLQSSLASLFEESKKNISGSSARFPTAKGSS